MHRGLAVLFAIGGGLAVGDLYWSQPLLALVGRDLHVGGGATGLLVTATQLGYAAGIFLVVPLGDLLDRRALVPAMLLASAAALVACAAAPTFALLVAASVAVGLTTVSGQLLTPLTGDLASDADRGRFVGIVVSGIVTGIIAARVVSGVVGGLAGWRAVFVLAAVLTAGAAVVLRRAIPRLPTRPRQRWSALLGSVVRLVASEPELRAPMLLGALGFAGFTMFWTSLTFLLASPPYSLPATVVGLFGLAGLLGSVAAQGAGRLFDRGLSVPVTGIAWAVVLGAWLLALVGAGSLVVVVAAVVVLDLGNQAANIMNQSRIFSLPGAARSRRNTAYVTGNFLGGAAGSLVASVLWGLAGWTGVAAAGTVVSLAALGVWAARRRVLSPGRRGEAAA